MDDLLTRLLFLGALFVLLACTVPALSQDFEDPVMPWETVDEEIYTDYEEQRYYFSSELSREMFLDDPDAYAAQPTPSPTTLTGETLTEGVVLETETITPPEQRKAIGLTTVFARLHPAFVHLPIALLIAALIAEFAALGIKSKRDKLLFTTWFCLLITALSGPIVSLSGWILAANMDYVAPLDSVLLLHRWLSVFVVLSSVALFLWAEKERRAPGDSTRVLFRVALLGTVVCVAVTSHFGATLVYGIDYLPF